MNKLGNFASRNIFNIFLGFLVVLNLLPILAPILAHFGINSIARPIYWIYSYSCHQFHWRSVHILDHQCAWCTRDMFLWGALLAVTIAVKKGWIKDGLKWYWLFPFIIPIALDGGIQTLATIFGYSSDKPFYLSTNFMRMFTGSIFGLGLGAIIAPLLFREQIEINKEAQLSDSTKA